MPNESQPNAISLSDIEELISKGLVDKINNLIMAAAVGTVVLEIDAMTRALEATNNANQ